MCEESDDVLWYLWFSHWCCWISKFSGILCHVNWLLVSANSKDPAHSSSESRSPRRGTYYFGLFHSND